MGFTGDVGDGVSGGGTVPSGVTLGEVSSAIRVEEITLTLTEITNRQATLGRSVAEANELEVGAVGGLSTFDYGVDYTAVGTTLNWVGLGLEPLLEVGDVLKITYFTTSP